MKLTSILIILLFAFTLAACGGGGGSSRTPEPITPEITDPDAEPDGPTAEEMAAAEKARQAKIMGLTMAIADPDGDGKFPEDNELTHRRPGETVMLATGGKTTVGSDELGKNDVNIKNANEFQPKSGSSADLMGYEPSMYERTTTKGATDTLTVYTNVEEAGDEAYNMYFANGTTRAGIDTVEDAIQPEGGAKTLYNTVTFDNDAIGSVRKYMKGPKIPTGKEQNKAVVVGDAGAFKGTFYDIPGKYVCTTACTLLTDEDDTLTMTGVLTFQPDSTNNDTQDAHVVADIHPDMDYLSFGYWVQSTPGSNGTKYGVSVFSDGSMPYGGAAASTEIQELSGKATYDGSATGLYARKKLTTEDGRVVVGTPVAAGQFSADVSLTAYFGNSASDTDVIAATKTADIADSLTYSINGTVDNFQDMSGDMIDDSWAVNLNKAEFESSGTATNTFMGTTGSGEMAGMWTGGFFGDHDDSNNPASDMRPTAVKTATKYPTGVAGEFTGHFTNGHVIGAFGATE